MAKRKMKKEDGSQVFVTAPKFAVARIEITGTAPYVQHKFSEKARRAMKTTQELGQAGKKGKKKSPRDFKADYEAAKHVSTDGWCGIPAPAFRNAIISACKMVGFAMTRAKLSVFIEADGFDVDDGTPLVKITKGKPEYLESMVRLATGVCSIAARPMWKPGWKALIRIRYDTEQFSLEDVTNLMLRVGMQVGVGEGRPDSKKSAGLGWGLFDLA